MDGAGKDVPSLYKGGPIIPRIKGVRLFHLRNNSQGLIIRRFGDGPSHYHWSVWDPHTKLTRLYGGHREASPPRDVQGFELPSFNTDGNGVLIGNAQLLSQVQGAGLGRAVIGEWGLTQEYDNQPARNGSWYIYGDKGENCDSSLGGKCTPALRLKNIYYNLAFGNELDDVAKVGVTKLELQWKKRDQRRFNTDGRLGFIRAYEYWLSEIDVQYSADSQSVQLASTNSLQSSGFDKIFSKHKFSLTDGTDPHMDFDIVLSKYVVEGNESYDSKKTPEQKTQTFEFRYNGQMYPHDVWSDNKPIEMSGIEPPLKAPATGLGFPSDLLERVGLGGLTDGSILGTGQSDEIGASLYVGVGPNGDLSVKPISGGIKGGTLQTKSATGSILVDVTGDGIGDIIFRSGNGLRYCAGKRTEGGGEYQIPRCGKVEGISELGEASTSMNSAGVEGYAYGGFAGVGYNGAFNNTYSYFSDVDGDGLIDFVSYGKVFYGLGEDVDKKIVRFAPNKALLPPVPGQTSSDDLSLRSPIQLQNEIALAGRSVEDSTQKLARLKYSQTTIFWEAPFDGNIRLDGSMKLVPGIQNFPALKSKADELRKYYYDCKQRPTATSCYDALSDPYVGHYSDGFDPQFSSRGDAIKFIDSPKASVELSLSRKLPNSTGEAQQPVECASSDLSVGKVLALSELPIEKECAPFTVPGFTIKVSAGDALYITYSVDPDSTAQLLPDAMITYVRVEGDDAFNLTTGGQDDRISPHLKCGWSDQGSAKYSDNCLLEAQTRYTYKLATGSLTSAPGEFVVLRSGSHRIFGGKFFIPTKITQDYDVFFDVYASESFTGASLTSIAPRLFRQSISDTCKSAADICTVDITPFCAMEGLTGENAKFCEGVAPTENIATRLVVQHIGVDGYTVRNISSLLSDLRWLVPPNITSILSETTNSVPANPKQSGDNGDAIHIPNPTTVFLPIAMGEQDTEYARITNGKFPNPNPDLNESSKIKSEIDFAEILDAEPYNVDVARYRQTKQLCGFARELIDFLNQHYSKESQPFAGDYGSIWEEEYSKIRKPCQEANDRVYALAFTTNETDEFAYKPRLNLPHLLRNLAVEDQMSSAETLLQRVFNTLELPRELLTDNAKVTRRGYRLPAKVNPLGCDLLTSNSEPVEQPIFGSEAKCKFRLLANFAMADLEKLVGAQEAANIHKLLTPLSNSRSPAFNLALTATVNGKPIQFRELTGEQAGNLRCDGDKDAHGTPQPVPKDTCLGNYGSFERLEQHLYPDANGDMFPRILTNRRAARAVAFSDDILDPHEKGVCISVERRYASAAAMEAKQDCPAPGTTLPEDQKYLGQPMASVEYQILENNQFLGRNRVFEFEANPLDILEPHFTLAPVAQKIEDQGHLISGNFSLLEIPGKPGPLAPGRYLIPRSPVDLLAVAKGRQHCEIRSERPLLGCRPWSRIGWSEILLGAQYRTLSDSHRTIDENSYSILRRRDLLRLHPEIEVNAQFYALQSDKADGTVELPLASEFVPNPQGAVEISQSVRNNINSAISLQKPDNADLKKAVNFLAPIFILQPVPLLPVVQHEVLLRLADTQWVVRQCQQFYAFYLTISGPTKTTSYPSGYSTVIGSPQLILAEYDRPPNVAKIGADWGFFAYEPGNDGTVILPKNLRHVRYGESGQGYHLSDPNKKLSSVQNICVPGSQPDFKACKSALFDEGSDVLNFKDLELIPLIHRFVGPTTHLSSRLASSGTIDLAQTSCVEPNPSVTTSCWKGQDDSVLLARPIIDDPTARQHIYSVSALVGFENPPIAKFRTDYDAICKLLNNTEALPVSVCNEQQAKISAGLSGASVSTVGSDALPLFPNRPASPRKDRTIEIFAPIQSSESETISTNGGVGPVNVNKSWTSKSTKQLFLDVNGDGYPDVISDGVATLTSPVGLSRKDWWRFFRTSTDGPSLSTGLRSNGLIQSSMSDNEGSGVGLSPSTFAKAEPKGTNTKTTGSPDGSVDPSFDLSFEQGRDNKFADLKDFNGDGIADAIQGTTVSDGIAVSLSAGSALGPSITSGSPQLNSPALSGFSLQDKFNTSHGAGFGVRLGYSYESGSVMAGMGISHRDNASEGTLLDFNGDGRVDVVLPVTKGSTNYLAVFLNLGNGYGPARLYEVTGWQNSETGASETTIVDEDAAFTFGIPVWLIKIVFTPSVKHANDQSRELVQLRDINADGAPDIVSVSGRFQSADSNGTPTLKLIDKTETHAFYNPDARYYLLSGITEPTGSQYYLSYGLYGNSGPEHGTSVWALTSVARDDGFEPTNPAISGKLPPDGQDVDLKLYDYSGGYFNRAERQFYGFSNRTEQIYGCDLAFDSADQQKKCLTILKNQNSPNAASLAGSAFHKLQEVRDTYSNGDYLTQGLLLSETILGHESRPESVVADNPGNDSGIQLISSGTVNYSIDDLSSLQSDEGGAANTQSQQCLLPDLQSGSGSSWIADKIGQPTSLVTTESLLSKDWSGAAFHDNGKVFGDSSICGLDLTGCSDVLQARLCRAGFVHEQTAFWAQQTGSVRQRSSKLQTFGDGETPAAIADSSKPHLTSLIAFDHDQWGQTLRFDSIGETIGSGADTKPVNSSSIHAAINYAQRQGDSTYLNTAKEPQALGYPILDLAESIQILPGAWSVAAKDKNFEKPLRAREALFVNNGTANLSDICIYPGGDGFQYTYQRNKTICNTYKNALFQALQDGYSTVESALRTAYNNTDGLPKGLDHFNAIIHHQLVEYDPYGNLTHAISPLSDSKEWTERRFEYGADPFLVTPTTTELTRCVEDVPGAGTDSPSSDKNTKIACTFGLSSLNQAVVRKPITHLSHSRIDPQFGMASETEDINGNSLLYDFDRWGRLDLIARSWGETPREQKTFEDRLKLALQKTRPNSSASSQLADTGAWRIMAIVDYDKPSEGLLRSNVRRFEPSDSYMGLLPGHSSTRESATFSDGLGHVIQNVQEADVCVAALQSIIDGTNPGARVGLANRCSEVASGMVTPGTATDVLGRTLQTFEPYAANSNSGKKDSDLKYIELQYQPRVTQPISQTTYDPAGRPLKVENRLSKTIDIGDGQTSLIATTQYRYGVLPERGARASRFESLSLSPRCTASAMWGDARGQTTDVFENQEKFYGAVPKLTQSPGQYHRDYDSSLAKCLPIETMQHAWSEDTLASEASPGGQPARVSYKYDPLQQLIAVDYPLDGSDRAGINVKYDDLGRMTEMREPNAGCVQYHYDGLQNLTSEVSSKLQPDINKSCETASKVKNEKTYRYSADRLLEMSYRSLEEQGAAKDQGDKVRFFYDRFPYAVKPGELIEASKFVPNDLANQRFVDQTGLVCENCIGQATVVTDRTGSISQTYNELGLPRRELRSIVGQLRKVKQSGGGSETYLPEVGFYQQDNSYTSYGDLIQQEFSERAPMNPSDACRGVETCLAHFTLGRRYSPDGAIARLIYNGKPLINAAHDALGRPAVRWTADGTVTGFAYDDNDLRMNQLSTITAGKVDEKTNLPVQVNGYQYDGGGNVLGYQNVALPKEDYQSLFDFSYDAANRLAGFDATVRKGTESLKSEGTYSYDSGNRFKTRALSIAGNPGELFQRKWNYHYNNTAGLSPVHAPSSIDFVINDKPRTSQFAYDDVGRMTRVGTAELGKETSFGVLSNRGMVWDAEGRLTGVRGVKDGVLPNNADWMREDYVYDYGGNRVLKIDRPMLPSKDAGKPAEEAEAATIYMTPYYARGLDGQGAVQIAEGSLPTASIVPSTNQGEDPITTYLYSDLAVGSVSASVTAFGEVEDANSIVIGRREYSPYGLELTNDGLAATGRHGVASLLAFHGKELDRMTGFSSFGARYYSRDVGIWLSQDSKMSSYLAGNPNGGVYVPANLSLYSYSYNSPLNRSDPTGMYVWVDDAAFAGVGGLVALSFKGAHDLIARNLSTKGEYSSSFIQGAASGLGILYAPVTGGSSVIGAGLAGSVIGNIAKQTIDNRGFDNFSGSSLAADAVVGTATSAIPIPGLSGIPLVTAGRNSLMAIGKSVLTKFANGSIENMATKTALKSAVGLNVYKSPDSAANEIFSSGVDYFRDSKELNSLNEKFMPGRDSK